MQLVFITSFCDCLHHYLFCLCPNRTQRLWECSTYSRRKKTEEWETIPMHREDGTGSITLRSSYVFLCVTEQWRGRLIFCGCLFCVYVLEEGRKEERHQGRSVRWREWTCRLGNVTLGRFVGFDPGKLMQNPSASIWFGKTLEPDLSVNNNYWVYINFLPHSLPQESWSPLHVSWG